MPHEEIQSRAGESCVMGSEVVLVLFKSDWAGRHLSRGLNAAVEPAIGISVGTRLQVEGAACVKALMRALEDEVR